MSRADITDVVVVGAGVAGMAAAAALARDGAKVTLLERRPFLGGRAYSYDHPVLGETIDSQHVVLGCCTNILDLIEQAGAADSIRWYDDLCFLEPGSAGGLPRQSWMRPNALPAPLHQALSFLRVPMLRLRDKAGIAAGLTHFLRGYPASDEESFATWLQRTGQTGRAIRHFWEPVVVGALNDTFERCSTKYAGQVFYESFLRSPRGGRLGIPTKPLSEFFSPVREMLERVGVDLRTSTSVDAISRTPEGRWQVLLGEPQISAGAIILAGDMRSTQKLIASFSESASPEATQGPQFLAAPITTIHLWYDREVTELDHAVLLDTRVQWMFHKSRIRGWEAGRGSYLELVISASWAEIGMGRQEILASALREVEMFFPRIRNARLIKSAVLKEARATFSVVPGLDRMRPTQSTPYPGLFLAGDWTATGWPSTMEGAVRSGRLAAGELVGDRHKFLAHELRATGIMGWLAPR